MHLSSVSGIVRTNSRSCVLAAKDTDTARKGGLFGGYMKLLPMFIFMMPGVVAYAIAQNPELLSFADGGYDAALPLMVKTVLAAGLRGLVVAGLLAALMSSESRFNSCSPSLLTCTRNTVHRPMIKNWCVKCISTIVLVALGIAWIL